MVKKSDWKTIDMPAQTQQFTMEMHFTQSDVEQLKQGHIPEEMEDKWFLYYQDNQLYIHRSWTGICIYIVSILQESNSLVVTVNRNPEQYQETNVEKDQLMLTILLKRLIGMSGENAELMKQYIKG